MPCGLTPTMSVSCGFTTGILSVGFQLVGRLFDESLLFQVGGAARLPLLRETQSYVTVT